MLEPQSPREAQNIVASYLKVVEAHAATDTYPGSLRDLPYPKDTIRAAFKTSTLTLMASQQLTPELHEYLEIAYVSLADYVDEECFTLLREFTRAGHELSTDGRSARERVTTDAWRRVTEQSRLAGQLASGISAEADRLRTEFRSWRSDAADRVFSERE